MLYKAQELSFCYQGETQQQVLRGVTLQLEAGHSYCLTGPSGSGKSTLLHLLGLIETPKEGQLLFMGQSVAGMKEQELNHLRRFKLGFIFQDFQLIDVLNVEENVEFFLTRQKIPASERQKLVAEAIEGVGLWEHRHKRPSQLSGGQKQRVAVARALAKKPLVIIADEPTASLDSKNGRQLMHTLTTLQKSHGVCVIVASHDPMVLEYGLQEIRLLDGSIVAHTPQDEVPHAR